MTITGHEIGKKYRSRWIFRNIHFQLNSGQPAAITGINGSGKSTLLRVIAGITDPNEGILQVNQKDLLPQLEDYTRKVTFCAPYIELIEEFTLEEHLKFHEKFKLPKCSLEEMMLSVRLESHRNVRVVDFSSGMKQRLRLALCLFFHSDVYLLDEPTSNLDRQGIDWYLQQVQAICADHVVVIASNVSKEYNFCQQFISLPTRDG